MPISTVSQVLSPAPWPDSAAYNLSLLIFFPLPSPCPTSIFFPRLLPCCPPPPPCTPPPLGCLPATVLKPDEGTADLPAGRVRLCIDADGSVTEVGEEHVHRVSPPPALPAPPAFPLFGEFLVLDCTAHFPWRAAGTVGKFTVELAALPEASCQRVSLLCAMVSPL